MTGSLQIKNGKYYVVARIPDDMGKFKQKWIPTGLTAPGNKRKANLILQQTLVELEQNQAVYAKEIPFIVWLEKWMEQKRLEVRLNTMEGYEIYLHKHILPYFEPLKLNLSKVSPQHIQDYYTKKLKEGLSPVTLKKHNAIIHGSLQEAYKKGLIAFNPSDRVSMPKQSKQKTFKGKAYTAEQANNLLAVLKGDVLYPVVVLALYYGLRKSEALGLRWQDIDFNANTLKVCNTVTRMRTYIEHEQTKSDASHRVLSLIPSTIPYFKHLLHEQQERRLLLGAEYTVTDHICVWPDGHLISPDYVSQHFKSVLTKNELPIIRFHDLRHTAGSLLFKQGSTVKQVQDFLGHEKSSTTLDIYTHIDAEARQETAYAMDRALKIDAC